MTPDSPGHAVELLDRAFNEGDLDAVLSIYEAAAVVVTEPRKLARGREELRSFFERVMRAGASAKQRKTHVIEADGLALFLSRWILRTGNGNPDATSQTFVATTVFRKQPDGTWKVLIDNPLGPLVLGPE
jgi:ketosteroid isomerase-like protein